jgi:ribonuclease PH
MNVVGISDGSFVEIQATGEEATYSRKQFNELMDSAEGGLVDLFEIQKAILADLE